MVRPNPDVHPMVWRFRGYGLDTDGIPTVTLYPRFNHGYVSIFPVPSALLMGCLHFGWSIVMFNYSPASQLILLNNRVNFQPLVNDLAF
jgi:hypothetical protein